MADRKYIVDMFEEVVDSIRQTGNITGSSEVSGVYTIDSANSLIDGWHVVVNDNTYEVANVTETGFEIEANTGIDFTGESWKALEPYYDYGHVLDILAKLTAKDENEVYKFQKYPLVALILDTEENHDREHYISYSFSPQVLILEQTDENYTSQDRMTNTYKPVLYPIYEDLIEAVKEYTLFYFQPQNLVPHTKHDRMTWGSASVAGNTSTVLNDYLDGIELNFDNIQVFKNYNDC